MTGDLPQTSFSCTNSSVVVYIYIDKYNAHYNEQTFVQKQRFYQMQVASQESAVQFDLVKRQFKVIEMVGFSSLVACTHEIYKMNIEGKSSIFA